FHQALSSLESHPELMRALGLIFDVTVPQNFLAQTAPGAFDRVAVDRTNFAWRVPTQSPLLETAYVHFTAGPSRFFMTASRTLTLGSAPAQVVGLLNLDLQHFGLAQVDVDGGMHKTIMLAETWNNPDPGRNLNPNAAPEAAPHPEVYDPDATL